MPPSTNAKHGKGKNQMTTDNRLIEDQRVDHPATEEELDAYRCSSCRHTMRSHRVAIVEPKGADGADGFVYVCGHKCDVCGCHVLSSFSRPSPTSSDNVELADRVLHTFANIAEHLQGCIVGQVDRLSEDRALQLAEQVEQLRTLVFAADDVRWARRPVESLTNLLDPDDDDA